MATLLKNLSHIFKRLLAVQDENFI